VPSAARLRLLLSDAHVVERCNLYERRQGQLEEPGVESVFGKNGLKVMAH
jgi:hypothetical protein